MGCIVGGRHGERCEDLQRAGTAGGLLFAHRGDWGGGTRSVEGGEDARAVVLSVDDCA
jgi:hypothetical protein